MLLPARLFVALTLLLPAVALAQPEEPEPAPQPRGAPPPASYPIEGEPPPPPSALDPTGDERRHDGFYLRIGIGFGWLVLNRDAEATAGDAVYTGESRIRGAAGMGEISIGGTVGSGLVLCGTLLGHEHREATLERQEGPDIEMRAGLSFGMIGMGGHYFPDERGGFHVGGTLGLAYAVAAAHHSKFGTLGGTGIGLSLASGYDWWVADQWALGVLGRISVARLRGEVTSEGITGKEDDTAAALGVMFSVLHH
jgi:hypothetical protein